MLFSCRLQNLPRKNPGKKRSEQKWVRALLPLGNAIKKPTFAADVVDAAHTTSGKNDAPPAGSDNPAVSANTTGHAKTLPAPASSNLLLWAGRSAVDRRLYRYNAVVPVTKAWRRPRVQIPAGPPFPLISGTAIDKNINTRLVIPLPPTTTRLP